jgi:endonuclease YncB( thermonuclease family)
MKRVQVLACLLLLCLPALARATSLQAKVVEIVDGNTMIVINVNRRIKVVLKGSDAPEDSQPFGDVARQHLADLVLGKEVLVDYTELGRDGHLVAKVFCNEMDVGQQMIRDGVAWYDRTYEKDLSELEQQLYEESELAARSEHRGLWQEAAPVAPWQFRLAQQNTRQTQTSSNSVAANSQIGPVQAGSARPARALRTGELGYGMRLKWQKLAPTDEYFSVLIPEEGQRYSGKLPKTQGLPLDLEFVVVNYNGVNYMVNWMTVENRTHPSVETLFERSVEGFKESLDQMGKRLGPSYACELNYDKDISLSGVPGRQYSVNSCAVPGVVRIYYKVNSGKVKMYLAATTLGIEGNPLVDQFFDSFRISAERNSAAADEQPSGSTPSLNHR